MFSLLLCVCVCVHADTHKDFFFFGHGCQRARETDERGPNVVIGPEKVDTQYTHTNKKNRVEEGE